MFEVDESRSVGSVNFRGIGTRPSADYGSGYRVWLAKKTLVF